jgi:hypothetical protein
VEPPKPGIVRWSKTKAKDSRRDAVLILREDLRRAPGVYLIRVVSAAQVVSDFSLEVQRAQAQAAPDLAPHDQEALQQVCVRCLWTNLCIVVGTCSFCNPYVAVSAYQAFTGVTGNCVSMELL